MNVYLRLKGGECGRLPECPPDCRGTHEKRLWLISRRAEPWGHFAVVRLNGEARVIDASLPTEVDRIPRGAIEGEPWEVARLWHEDNESHVFGGPNVAKALREAIAAANREAGR